MSVETIVVIVVQGVMLPLMAWTLRTAVELKVTIAVIKTQIDRIVADAESEKQTRHDSNRRITNELDQIKLRLGA